MNETVTNTTYSVRHGKDLSLDSPLLNLILAASLLTKITKPKTSGSAQSFKRGPPLPYKFSEDYYGGLPWYPHDSSHYYKLKTSLNSEHANFPIKQHIIHIHQRPATSTILEVAKQEAILTTTESSASAIPISEIPLETATSEEGTTISDTVTEINLDKYNSEEAETANDEVVASPSNQLTQELKDFLTDFFKQNNIITAPQHMDKIAETFPSLNKPHKSEKVETADENMSEVTSEQLVENMSETMVDKIAKDLPKNATENEVKHMSAKVIQNLPASILENIPPEMLEQISEKISEQITEKLSEKFSKDVSNHMLEKLAQLIPDKDNQKEITETSENVSDNEENTDENKIPDGSDENLPVFSNDNGEYEQELPYQHLTQVKFINNEQEDGDSMMMDASTVDLQPSETQKKSRKTSKQNSEEDEYVFTGTGDDEDDDDDDDDILNDSDNDHNLGTRVSPKFGHKFRSSTELPQNIRKGSKGKISVQLSQERINSKRPSPNKRRTTPISLIYDEYEEAAPSDPSSMGKRKVQYYNSGNVKKGQRKPSPSSAEDDFDNEEQPQRQVQAQMKKNKKGAPRRRTTSTTPIYDDYYNDPVEENEEDQEYEEEGAVTTLKPRPTKRPSSRPGNRQQGTTTTTTTEGTTITDTGPTETGTDSPATPSMNTTATPTPPTNVTSGVDYPYYGNNNYQNISITYGPPVHHYPGYGPSNGNEQVSFTYAPPSSSGGGGGGSGFSGPSGSGGTGTGVAAAGVAPMLDSWYNQYARNSMYKRIHDLLTPNNFYNQYDVNYNDASA